jgi:16S rRNA (adenine1518-N6/adenine1519-N6)-dimethyltransferase
MAQSKRDIQDLLSSANTEPRHRFGQNFMIDQNLVRTVADAGQIAPGDLVIEVGPGTGTLTEELLERGADVVAVEIDRDLAGLLKERFGSREKFRLIEGDALATKHLLNEQLISAIGAARARGQRVKLVANLPYNIASPLVIELLIIGADLLAFTVQKEVADRLRAKENSDDYGPLTVMVQMLARVEVLRTLSPQVFWPQPKIESALVRLTREDKLGGRAGQFGKFVQKLFSFRRKTLRKALANMDVDAERVLARTGIDGTLRPETLAPGRIFQLFEALPSGDGGESRS